jgi:hypothetical protein
MCSFFKFYWLRKMLQAALCSAIQKELSMKTIRTVLIAALLASLAPAHAAEPESPALGHALTLIHLFVRIAAESETPQQSLKAVDEVLLGRNAAANEAAAGLVKEMLTDVPPQHRATIVAIGRDLAALARKDLSRQAVIDPLQARRDLTSMGLSYHDSKQFLDAVKRNDAIAAELFIAGRGVDLSARDFWGRDAVDFARANGNERLAELIARNRPAER